MPALEIHSRKSQSARTKAADAFRAGRNVVMFTSDVSARGVDYPDVSLVIQVCPPVAATQIKALKTVYLRATVCWLQGADTDQAAETVLGKSHASACLGHIAQ